MRGSRTELTKCILSDLQVPAYAEIVLEGFIYPNDTAVEGPYGDHTGYYNEQDTFPVMTIEKITMRENRFIIVPIPASQLMNQQSLARF